MTMYHRLWGESDGCRRYCFVAIHRPTGAIYHAEGQTGQVDLKRQKANKGNLMDEWKGTKYITPEGPYSENTCPYKRYLLTIINNPTASKESTTT